MIGRGSSYRSKPFIQTSWTKINSSESNLLRTCCNRNRPVICGEIHFEKKKPFESVLIYLIYVGKAIASNRAVKL